ncbi:RNA methyltransferase [Mycena chlorophos]|uniref:rRNA methyltransferase 2, mitochondrial n=1 Tax=Mycena chlorophos TaxID=658473 RepID=A0A8H6VTC8_MYCCL|nr:RNA methyltransferase [Mycena chlorophos]
MGFRPTLARSSKKSSTQWLARQARDPFVRQRNVPLAAQPKERNRTAADFATYRSRAAFKLLEIEEKYKFLAPHDVRIVVDLGAAPGGWSQVAAKKLGWVERPRVQQARLPAGTWSDTSPYADWDASVESDMRMNRELGRGRGMIVALDLLPMSPIPGVQFLQQDIFAPETDALLQRMIAKHSTSGKADVILCDMAANATGNSSRDIEASLDICKAVFAFSECHLRSEASIGREFGGVLLIKHFVHERVNRFRDEVLATKFRKVTFAKPAASRAESKEGYFLCRGWLGAT